MPPAAQKIADHFSSVTTMSGEFVQFGPRGRADRRQVLHRSGPGKIRFNYEAPSGYRVISDGQSVVIHNKKLNTCDLYPLSKTPLKLLLDDRIDLSGDGSRASRRKTDLTTIQLADKSVFGNATITMMFDPKTYDLGSGPSPTRRARHTVMIFNVKQGVQLDAGLFKIDYKRKPRSQRRHEPLAHCEHSACSRVSGIARVPEPPMPFSIATWNINSVRLRLPLVERLLRERGPMCSACRKPSARTSCFRSSSSRRLGYPAHRRQRPEGLSRRRDDLAAAARGRRAAAVLRHRGQPASADHGFGGRRTILLIHNFYVPAGGDEPDPEINPKFRHKLDFVAEMNGLPADGSEHAGSMLVGDLNIAPLEHDVWSHKQLLKVVSHTPVETESFEAMRQAGDWVDLMRLNVPAEQKLYTWWSYRARDWAAVRPRPPARPCLVVAQPGRRSRRHRGAARGARLGRGRRTMCR